jgi:catechol 2,3-dioxygenase-like lactoylglutathione lyase family enzyme
MRAAFTEGAMIIDHIGLSIANYDLSKTFYSKALAPLGIELVMEVQGWAGYGRNQKPEFWFAMQRETQRPMHIAFAAETREQVRAFYRDALAAGARENGGPGIRDRYHPNYYAAFVFDLDGHNIEAVCHRADE